MKDTVKQKKASLTQALRVAVLSLELEPGADLDEASLAQRYGLSRTPLREALREMAGEGYVELRENRGARVSDMSYTTVRQFFLAAPMMYGAILQLAAANRSRAQLVELKNSQKQFVAALHSASAADRMLANNRFHDITGEMAANVYLLPSFKRLLVDHARIGMTFFQPGTAGRQEKLALASAQHDAIIDAIEAGDSQRASELAEAHWNLSRGQIETFVTPAGVEAQLGFANHAARKTA